MISIAAMSYSVTKYTIDIMSFFILYSKNISKFFNLNFKTFCILLYLSTTLVYTVHCSSNTNKICNIISNVNYYYYTKSLNYLFFLQNRRLALYWNTNRDHLRGTCTWDIILQIWRAIKFGLTCGLHCSKDKLDRVYTKQ